MLKPDPKEPMAPYRAIQEVLIPFVACLLIIPAFVMYLGNRTRGRSRNASRTNCLMLWLLISSALSALLYIATWTVCWDCAAEWSLYGLIRSIMRSINILFMIHRAKLSQGMAPILGMKAFETIMPICMVLPYISIFVSGSVDLYLNWIPTCTSYADTDLFHYCSTKDDIDNDNGGTKIGVISVVIYEFVLSTFLLTLFVVPLYRVYRADLGSLNDNQMRQRAKLKDLLIWSVVLCFINQVTSTFWWFVLLARTPVLMTLWSIGKLDPAINVWTSWLMISRNRQYLLKRMKCFCCKAATWKRSLTQSAINIPETPSRTSSRHFVRMPSTGSVIAQRDPANDLADIRLEITGNPGRV